MIFGFIVVSDYIPVLLKLCPPKMVHLRSAAKIIPRVTQVQQQVFSNTLGTRSLRSIEGKRVEIIITIAGSATPSGPGLAHLRHEDLSYIGTCSTRAHHDGACNALVARSFYTSVY